MEIPASREQITAYFESNTALEELRRALDLSKDEYHFLGTDISNEVCMIREKIHECSDPKEAEVLLKAFLSGMQEALDRYKELQGEIREVKRKIMEVLLQRGGYKAPTLFSLAVMNHQLDLEEAAQAVGDIYDTIDGSTAWLLKHGSDSDVPGRKSASAIFSMEMCKVQEELASWSGKLAKAQVSLEKKLEPSLN